MTETEPAILEVLRNKCQLIDDRTIRGIGFIPEFVEGLSSYDEELNDRAVFEVLQRSYRKIYPNTCRKKAAARKILNRVSGVVTGERDSWKSERYKTRGILSYNAPLSRLYSSCPSFRRTVIDAFQTVPEFQNALLSYDGEFNERVVFELLRLVYYKIEIWSHKQDARKLLNKISRTLTGDPRAWRIEELERSEGLDQ